MSIKLMSMVWQDHTGNLTGIEKAVLLRMADFAADNGTQIFPTVKRLALDIGYSERAIKYAINRLIEKKYLTKTIRTSKTVHISNLYRIIVKTLEAAVTLTPKRSVDKSSKKRGGVGHQVHLGGAPDACDPPLNQQKDFSNEKFEESCIGFSQFPSPEIAQRREAEIAAREGKYTREELLQQIRKDIKCRHPQQARKST